MAVPTWGCATPHPLAYTPAVPEPIRRVTTTVEVVPVTPEAGTQAHLDGKIGEGAAIEYLWSVRARFRLDGQERASRWSMNQDQDARAQSTLTLWFPFGAPVSARELCLYDGIRPLRHHRFRTPRPARPFWTYGLDEDFGSPA